MSRVFDCLEPAARQLLHQSLATDVTVNVAQLASYNPPIAGRFGRKQMLKPIFSGNRASILRGPILESSWLKRG